MLTDLHVQNIALIDDCSLSFGPHLNVLSGETGAGKSVIIDSLGFVLGSRADKTLIRHGKTSASVEAIFSVSDTPSVRPVLEDMGIEADDDTLILYRTMSETKSEIRINGRAATLAMLRDVSRLLVDILGQHENQSLLSVATHIKILDKYGDASILPEKERFEALYNEYKSVYHALDEMGDEAQRLRRLDILEYQIKEISDADLKEGEEEELLASREKYRNAEKLLSAVAAAKQSIDGEDAFSVPSALAAAMSALRQVSSLDKALEESYERLDAAYTEVRDIASDLDNYVDSFDFDGATAEYVEKRVDLIRTLKRKYGATVSDVLSALDTFRAEYDDLSGAADRVADLTAKKEKLYASVLKSARALSDLRRKYAVSLKGEIERELSMLGMKGSIFEVNIDSAEDYLSSDGADKIEFLISPNPGEPLRGLSRIISGGEMSRFMLALKVITARLEGISTLVFDEVDAGISGKIGEVVAEKLAQVSRSRQVIAITHLPQVAAMSDDHYLIEKNSVDNKTYTTITKLDEEGVIGEVERLSAGVGEYGTLHARELRARALSIKDAEA